MLGSGILKKDEENSVSHFHQAMKSKLEILNNESCEVYITGDINIDFFRYNTDNQTSEYLDMLLNLGYLPIITTS